ncbi:MAG TPA: CmcJ/NvfI family oxidoreductase [Stellaceae bacterium]|nr:CmcJ/NvfI family oxidoreductase [Stellaceae bacterium]
MNAHNRPLSDLAHVDAALNYLAPMTARPRNYACEPPAGVPRSNTAPESHTVPIYDVRPIASEIALDREGFTLLRHETAIRDFWDDDELRKVYYPEAEAAIAQATGAARVFIFDHTRRKRVPGTEDRAAGLPRQPATRVHVDHTATSGPQRVRDLLGDEAEELLRGRVQVINLWRPIRGPLRDAPLAVCDAGSVAPADLVPADLVYANRIGETYAVTYNPSHRWFFVPAMQRDEALLIKCFDSRADGRARFAPHTAFDDPTAPLDMLPRESIEIRSLVFHHA